MFSPTSRYYGLPTATHQLPDGRTVVYVLRRIVPHPESLSQTGTHVVLPGEAGRPDLIAAKEIGSAEMWWQLADANRAMDPDEIAAVGAVLRVTLPAGISASGTNLLGGTHG
jgi:hypothetical protein